MHLGLLLSFVAGAVNAGGFLAVGQYTSHMTGIASSIADHLVLHQTQSALLAAGFLLTFIAGAIVSTLIIRWARKRDLNGQYALALLLEAVLLLSFGIAADRIDMPVTSLVMLLCFIMGLQNAIITKISNAVIRTTHITGLATDIGIEIGRWLYGREAQQSLMLHTVLLLGFLIGGLVGAFSFKAIGYVMTVPLALLLIITASLPVLHDLKH